MLGKGVPVLLCSSCGRRYRHRRGEVVCPRCGCTSWVAAWVADRSYAREM